MPIDNDLINCKSVSRVNVISMIFFWKVSLFPVSTRLYYETRILLPLGFIPSEVI